MIKVHMPNALQRTALNIAKQHPLNGETAPMDDNELRMLLDKIEQTPSNELTALSYTLNVREIKGLCAYLPGNRLKKPAEKIAAVLQCKMAPRYFSILFSGWQDYPLNGDLLKLLADNDRPENRGEGFPFVIGKLQALYMIISTPKDFYYQVCRSVYSKTKGYENTFCEKFRHAGLRGHTPLEERSKEVYLSTCKFENLVLETDDGVKNAIKACGQVNVANEIITNLLEKGSGNKNGLLRFKACYREIFSRFKAPRREAFPLTDLAFTTYRWWCNYNEMEEGFRADTDPKRIQFWMHYLDKCEVTRRKSQQFIVFDFGKCCAVESEVVGTLYFFSTDYFKEVVLPKIGLRTGAEARSWLKNDSRYLYAKIHLGFWESEVASNLRRYGMI